MQFINFQSKYIIFFQGTLCFDYCLFVFLIRISNLIWKLTRAFIKTLHITQSCIIRRNCFEFSRVPCFWYFNFHMIIARVQNWKQPCSGRIQLLTCWNLSTGLYVLDMSRTRLRVNPHSTFAWMSRNSLLEAGAKSEGEVTVTGLEPRTT